MNRNSSGSSAILAIVASMVVAFSPATVKADVLRVDPSFGGVNMRVLLEQKRFAEARDMATARLRSAPNDGNMLAILGFAQAGLEEWQNARQSVSRAIELLPEDRRNEMRALLAEIELRAGNAETAESLLRTVLAAEPNNVRALLGLGFMYVRMDENAQAVTSFERVLGLVPDQPTALVALMELHLRSGNYAAITRLADRIGPESPSRGAGYYFQALSVLRQPEPDLAAAADLLESALSVSLSTPRVLATLGYVRLQQGRPQDAVRRLTHAVDLDAGFFDAHRLLGYGWLQLNEPRAASRHLQLALDIRESPEVRRMLGRAYLAQGDSEQGVAQLIKSLDQSEQTTNAQLELESLYQYTSGNFDQSEESLRQALANTPEAEHLRFLLIVALIKQEDFEAASREAQIALPLFPAHSETLHNLYAMARLGSGAYDEAEAALNRALSDNPASKTTLVNLSTLYFQRGQFQRAESQLQTILENEPDDREARIRLSRVYQAARNTLAAQNVLTRGSDTVPSDGVILRELVHLKMRQREHGDALLYARAMVARYPRLFEAYVLEAQSLASLGRETDAIEVLNRGFDEAGQTQGALAVSASLARVHGWHEAAVKFLQLHNEQFGLEDPRLRKLYAIELIETGESVLAREVIQDGLSVTDPDVIFLLARSYLIEGDQARAEEFIDAALQAGVPADDIARQRIELGVSIRIKDLESDLESAPHEAPRYAALAEAHEFMGNFDAAIKAYDQGLGLTDQDLQFRAHIARLHLKNGSTQQALAIARSVADDANATTGLKFQANAVLGMAYARQGETSPRRACIDTGHRTWESAGLRVL